MTYDDVGGCRPQSVWFFHGECPIHEIGRQVTVHESVDRQKFILYDAILCRHPMQQDHLLITQTMRLRNTHISGFQFGEVRHARLSVQTRLSECPRKNLGGTSKWQHNKKSESN